ncbi:NUDIX domain-containing protein [Limnohabitans radicicola]|uniref:GDP-mannose pyrophosphatase n=1 Tax=Limnohabitans radicicola TaxID=2771427 RepID=A0A927IJG8_9BURK|nr:NUDIX hydrolase [Limnohabitans radicicola]MBD8050689.1 NUDIX hydrolase [Limnohabitans radicicola]
MSDEHLIEQSLERQELFKGRFLHAFRDTVRLPDGGEATREYVVHPGAVVVVPLLQGPNGQTRIVLERQYRYPVGQVMIELPAGKLDAGEDPLLCGQRELFEETGYRAHEWARAGQMHLAIAYSTEVIHIYFARGLTSGERQLDQGEFLDVFSATPDELMAWCREGKVTDAKTLSCMVWLQNVLSGDWPLDWQSAPT